MSAGKVVAIVLLCLSTLFMLGVCVTHILFTVNARGLTLGWPLLLLIIPQYAAVVSYAVAFALGLAKICCKFNYSRCAACTNTSADVVFLLTAGASVISAAYLLAFLGSFVGGIFLAVSDVGGPIRAELVFIVLAVGFYAPFMCLSHPMCETSGYQEQSTEMKSC